MKLQTLQILQIFIECRIIVGGARCTYPSIHLLTTLLIEHMRAFCRYTRRRFEPTHGSLSLSLLSLFSLSLSLSLLSALFSPLPVTMTMITRSVGSLCTQSSDLPECQCAWASVLSLFGEHVHITCKNHLSRYSCASLVPLGMEWACICAGKECCVWLCVGGVWLC